MSEDQLENQGEKIEEEEKKDNKNSAIIPLQPKTAVYGLYP